jgi:hypothetical protein
VILRTEPEPANFLALRPPLCHEDVETGLETIAMYGAFFLHREFLIRRCGKERLFGLWKANALRGIGGVGFRSQFKMFDSLLE